MRQKYKPAKAYILPAFAVIFVATGIGIYIFALNPKISYFYFLFIVIPLSLMLLYVNLRFIYIDDEKLCIRTIFGKKCVSFDEIVSVKVVRMGIRNVLYIEAKNDILITPIVFSGLDSMKDVLVRRLGDRVNTEGWRLSFSDLIVLYFVLAFLIFAIIIKLF